MVKKAKAAGQFLGGIFNNPAFVILGGLAVVLLFFQKDIRNAFGSLGESFGAIDITLPEIKLPDITFPEFPDITFPDFSSIFQGFQDQLSSLAGQTVPSEAGGPPVTIPPDTTVTEEGTVVSSTPPTIDLGVSPSQLDPLGEISFNQLRSQVFDTLTQTLGLTSSEAFAALKDVSFQEGGFSALDDILQSFNTPFTPPIPPDQPSQDFGFDDTVLNLIGTSQEFTGGGVGFMGGVINPTPITTLTQVLDLFPNLTASQAADFLGENFGILPEAALQIGGDVINISGDPSQPILDQPSSLGTTGISPQELFKLLFPNLISNF